jgi:hypothetical protein
MMAKGDSADIMFFASVSVTQSIELLNDDWTMEGILEGLHKGTLLTTMEHDHATCGDKFVVVAKNMEKVAKIVSQQVSDADYTDFELDDFKSEIMDDDDD